MATAKLSDYMGRIWSEVYLHPQRTAKVLDANLGEEDSEIFAKVFPLPAYYGLEVRNGSFAVTHYESRTKGAEAKQRNSKIETYRDYYILDTEAFESFLESRKQDIKRRLPKGFSPITKPSGFKDVAVLESLTPEAAAEYARQLATQKTSKPKRVMTPEHKEKIAKALAESRKKRSKK